MEAIIILFFLVPILFIVFLVSDPFKRQRELAANRKWDGWIKDSKKNPKTFYKLTKEEQLSMARSNRYGTNEQIGKRGGRYETRYSKKTGKPYRHYF